MFIGTYENSIDEKNRMIVPARFREELGGTCILTVAVEKHLYMYPVAEFEKLMDRFSGLPSMDPDIERVKRKLTKDAMPADIDKQGRMVINQRLRDIAGIEKEIVTVGVSNRIEIWSKEEWERTDGGETEGKGFVGTLKEYGI